VLSALAVLSPAATAPATAFALSVAQRRRFPTAALVCLVGIAAHAVQYAWRPAGGISYAWWLVLMTAAYGALLGWGSMTQARRALLESLRERAARAEAEQERRVAEARVAERTRIAREMHDVLAHRLSLVATYAGALEYRPDSSPEQLAQAAGVVRAGVHEAMVELRDIVGVLRDGDHDDQRPQPVLGDISRLVEESQIAGQRVVLDNRVLEPAAVSDVAGRTAYRVVQEGLTNARKHAPGQSVRVVIATGQEESLTVELRNSLAAQGLSGLPGAGVGLAGLSERVRLAGGDLEHELGAGEFRLSARLPA
jgi:signal transduction histidine kinase